MATSTIRRARRIILQNSAKAAAPVYIVCGIDIHALRYATILWEWFGLAPCRWFTLLDIRTMASHSICVRLHEIERQHDLQRWILRGVVVQKRPAAGRHPWNLYAAVQITYDERLGFARIRPWPGWADRDAIARGRLADMQRTYLPRPLRAILAAS